MTTNTPAVRNSGAGTIAKAAPDRLIATLNSMVGEIRKALPAHMSADRIARIMSTQIRTTPKLAQCSQGSFFGALLTASALGLEPGIAGECYLIPYGRECQLVIGYQGVTKLFWQHPLAKRLAAEYVCEHDEFDYDKGLELKLHHRPAAGDRGSVVAYYAIAELTTGALALDVFTPEQIKALRGGKVGTSGIDDPEHWMERKTALKQVLKLMPRASELSATLRIDEQVGSMATAKAVAAGTIPHIDDATGEVLDAEIEA